MRAGEYEFNHCREWLENDDIKDAEQFLYDIVFFTNMTRLVNFCGIAINLHIFCLKE